MARVYPNTAPLPPSLLSIKTGGTGLAGAIGGKCTPMTGFGAKQDSSVWVKEDSRLCVAASLEVVRDLEQHEALEPLAEPVHVAARVAAAAAALGGKELWSGVRVPALLQIVVRGIDKFFPWETKGGQEKSDGKGR